MAIAGLPVQPAWKTAGYKAALDYIDSPQSRSPLHILVISHRPLSPHLLRASPMLFLHALLTLFFVLSRASAMAAPISPTSILSKVPWGKENAWSASPSSSTTSDLANSRVLGFWRKPVSEHCFFHLTSHESHIYVLWQDKHDTTIQIDNLEGPPHFAIYIEIKGKGSSDRKSCNRKYIRVLKNFWLVSCSPNLKTRNFTYGPFTDHHRGLRSLRSSSSSPSR
jgi:hypothetical protein